MNKKLIALAVGAVLTVPMAASADVKVFGKLQVELGNESSSTGGGTATDGVVLQGGGGRFDNTGTTMEDNKRGLLGVHASEKLGNGLTGLAHFEWQVDTTTANNANGSRQSYVGLKGSFGTVKLGALAAPYKYTGGVKYDPFVTTNLEARRNGGMLTSSGNSAYGQNGFMQSAIGYKTPKMGGFSAWVNYVPDEAASTYKDVSAAAKYKGGNFEVFVAYGKNDANNLDATKFGGMYKMGMHKFKIQYEDLDNNGLKGDIWFLGYEGKMGNNVLVAQYGKGEAKYTTKQKSDYYALGVVHLFSKKTRLIAGYSSTTVDNVGGVASANSDRDVFSVALRKDF